MSATIQPPLTAIPQGIQCAEDYERLAGQFIPADRLSYIAGGSGDEQTLTNNRKVFQNSVMTPRLFSSDLSISTETQILQQTLAHPIMLAPVAYQKLVHPDAEVGSASAAKATDSGFICSTLSSVAMETVAESAGRDRWFQLYVQPLSEHTRSLIDRAVLAGYQVIVLTVDAAIQQPGRRARQSGFVMPKEITAANLASLPPLDTREPHARGSRVVNHANQHAVTLAKLADILAYSPLPVIVKGLLNPEDAQRVQSMGAAGVVVSNHGGRTLDQVPASLSVLAQIREAVGDSFPVLFDSGVRSGQDVFTALSAGADAVLIGRLQLYALGVAGALGVAHLLTLLREELEITMAMMGCSQVSDIRQASVVYHLEDNNGRRT